MSPNTWSRYQQEVPAPLGKRDSSSMANPVSVYPCTAQIFRYPPQNPAQSLYYTGTVDWEAKEGAYMVGTFNDFENPAKMVDYTQPMMLGVNNVEDTTTDYNESFALDETSVWAPQMLQDGSTPPYSYWPAVKLYPLNQMGMIFTGLTIQSTLTIKMKVYYESFPSLAQKEILTLARPSTKYDPVVLELVAAVMRSLPSAVAARENAEGDWWDRVLKAIQIVAPVTLGLFGLEALAPAAYTALQGMRAIRN